MNRDYKKELQEIGEAIGKLYKTRSGLKAMCVGDDRLCSFRNEERDVLRFIAADTTQFFITPDGKYGFHENSLDIIDEWIEPKPKKKLAHALCKDIVKKFYYIPSILFESETEAKYRNGNDFCKWPFGEWIEIED